MRAKTHSELPKNEWLNFEKCFFPQKPNKGPWAVYRHYQTNIRAIQRQIKLESRPVYIVMLEMLATTMRKIYTICDETIRTSGFS